VREPVRGSKALNGALPLVFFLRILSPLPTVISYPRTLSLLGREKRGREREKEEEKEGGGPRGKLCYIFAKLKSN